MPSSKDSLNALRAKIARLIQEGQPGEAMFAWMRFLQDEVPGLPESEQVLAHRYFEEFVDVIDPGDDELPTAEDQ